MISSSRFTNGAFAPAKIAQLAAVLDAFLFHRNIMSAK